MCCWTGFLLSLHNPIHIYITDICDSTETLPYLTITADSNRYFQDIKALLGCRGMLLRNWYLGSLVVGLVICKKKVECR
jgi:hypothetical protein